jgi:hypothetical protein
MPRVLKKNSKMIHSHTCHVKEDEWKPYALGNPSVLLPGIYCFPAPPCS